MDISRVDIAIPVLNEEATLGDQIETIVQYVRQPTLSCYDFRILIADNGSDDQTPNIGKQLQDQYPGLVQYHRVDFRGVGRALKQVWGVSSADIVGYMDLDLATSLEHLPEALHALISEEADIVYGTRLHRDSKVIGRSIKRTIVSRIFNKFLQSYLRVDLSDAMCGFKFLKRKWLDDLISHGADSNGWFFCAEVIIVADALRLTIHELPVNWTDAAESKVNIPGLTREYFAAMRILKQKLRER